MTPEDLPPILPLGALEWCPCGCSNTRGEIDELGEVAQDTRGRHTAQGLHLARQRAQRPWVGVGGPKEFEGPTNELIASDELGPDDYGD